VSSGSAGGDAPAAVSPVALVSGGSRGLGAEMVRRLLADGWRVAAFSRTANDFVEKTRAAHSEDFHWAPADLADTESLRGFVRDVARRFGRLDALVNNAAALPEQQLSLTAPASQIANCIAVNLTGPIILAQAAARVMSRDGGAIVNVSSINAIRGYRGVAVYGAAKAGLDGFGRSLARELGPMGIRVNSVVPGYFTSDMTVGVTDDNREKIRRRTPLGRLADIGEIADVAHFLITPGAGFVTGQTIVVDGGITC
jgi:3-oxoacyl-[acyl-carrier protein] reductase